MYTYIYVYICMYTYIYTYIYIYIWRIRPPNSCKHTHSSSMHVHTQDSTKAPHTPTKSLFRMSVALVMWTAPLDRARSTGLRRAMRFMCLPSFIIQLLHHHINKCHALLHRFRASSFRALPFRVICV